MRVVSIKPAVQSYRNLLTLCFAIIRSLRPVMLISLMYHQKRSFAESKWFTRGWTLQELIAPSTIIFFDENCTELGTKATLQESISKCTRIPESILSGEDGLDTFNVAQRMSWAAERQTTRIEDRAYCLLGIFGVNIPLLYGEKENAFIRLQEEIMRVCEDHSLFAWRCSDTRGILATSPAAFIDSHDIMQFNPFDTPNSPFTVSSIGVHLELRILGVGPGGLALAILHCKKRYGKDKPIAIYVKETLLNMERFTRVRTPGFEDIYLNHLEASQYPPRKIWLQTSRIMRMQEPKDGPSLSPYSRAALALIVGFDEQASLFNAVTQGSLDIAWLLLTKGEVEANLNRAWDGRTLLSWAAATGQTSMTKLLLKRGAAVNIDGGSGQSALSCAAEKGHLETCKILLGGGADIDARGDNRSPLIWAAVNGHQAIVQLLLEVGANTETRDKSGKTPLFTATERGHEAIVELLLLLGDEANTEAEDKWDSTPLSLAAKNGHESIVWLLLDAGADVSAKDHWKRTPMYWATIGKHTAVIKLLQSRS